MSFTDDGFWEEAQYRYISNGPLLSSQQTQRML